MIFWRRMTAKTGTGALVGKAQVHMSQLVNQTSSSKSINYMQFSPVIIDRLDFIILSEETRKRVGIVG